MKHTSLLATALLLFASCASGPTPRDLIQFAYYRVTGKVMIVCPTAVGLSFKMVREKNAVKEVQKCQAEMLKSKPTAATPTATVATTTTTKGQRR